jgi:hypothetical protein
MLKEEGVKEYIVMGNPEIYEKEIYCDGEIPIH